MFHLPRSKFTIMNIQKPRTAVHDFLTLAQGGFPLPVIQPQSVKKKCCKKFKKGKRCKSCPGR